MRASARRRLAQKDQRQEDANPERRHYGDPQYHPQNSFCDHHELPLPPAIRAAGQLVPSGTLLGCWLPERNDVRRLRRLLSLGEFGEQAFDGCPELLVLPGLAAQAEKRAQQMDGRFGMARIGTASRRHDGPTRYTLFQKRAGIGVANQYCARLGPFRRCAATPLRRGRVDFLGDRKIAAPAANSFATKISIFDFLICSRPTVCVAMELQ